MKHFASPAFWRAHALLPQHIQESARKHFDLLKENPTHPSLHMKRIGKYRSVRIGMKYRALAVEAPEGCVWFWIGSHADYDKLLK